MIAQAASAVEALTSHVPWHSFLIAIDSDGCVFDTMEIKQKECFIPNTCKHFDLQAVARFAREAGEFVNLYSRWRGQNRFKALIQVFDLLRDWERVRERNVEPPRLDALRRWTANETRLSNATLREHCLEVRNSELEQVLRWSEAVSNAVEEMIPNGMPPFPSAPRALAYAAERADVFVSSQTPTDDLAREWSSAGLDRYVFGIGGQDAGTKAEQIGTAMAGKYASERVLMIGDAIGDLDAARSNGVCFYPIVPGAEDESWRELLANGFDRFFSGAYVGQYEQNKINEFERFLPANPPWIAADPTWDSTRT